VDGRDVDAQDARHGGRGFPPLQGLHGPGAAALQFFSGSLWSWHTAFYATPASAIALPGRDWVVSNLSMASLKEYVGERVIDRMKENGGKVIIFDWESHRGTRLSESENG
jgi:hypothetical protein